MMHRWMERYDARRREAAQDKNGDGTFYWRNDDLEYILGPLR